MRTHKDLSEEYQSLVSSFGDGLRNSPNMTDDEMKALREGLDRFVYSLLAKASE